MKESVQERRVVNSLKVNCDWDGFFALADDFVFLSPAPFSFFPYSLGPSGEGV
jgi:hypothetical protein